MNAWWETFAHVHIEHRKETSAQHKNRTQNLIRFKLVQNKSKKILKIEHNKLKTACYKC